MTLGLVLSRVGVADPEDAAGALDRFGPTRTMADRGKAMLRYAIPARHPFLPAQDAVAALRLRDPDLNPHPEGPRG